MSEGPGPAGTRPPAQVGRTSLFLVPVALAARGAAFVVPAVMALWFGVGEVTDAWYWALAFPTFVLVLASTALGTASMPAIAAIRERQPARLPQVTGGLIVLSGLGALAFGLAIALLSGPALPVLTDFAPPTRALAQAFLWELVPFMVLTTAASVVRVSVEVHQRFFEISISPVIRAGTVILSTGLLLGPLGPHAMPWGMALGELVQLGWWLFVLRRAAGFWPRPALALDPSIVAVARDLGPILGGEVLVALTLVVDKGFAALLSAGSVATLEFADRARVIPQTLLESTLLMVAWSSWNRLFAQGRREEARQGVSQSIRWTLALAAPVLAGMFIGREVLVALFFQRGAFTAQDTQATATVLAWYLPGVLPNLVGILAVRAHVVERKLRLILLLGLVSVLTNALLNALLMGPMGLRGLALATTLTMFLIPGLYLWALARTWQVRPTATNLRPWALAIGLAGASAAVAAGVEWQWGPPRSLADPLLWLAALPCLALLGLGWRWTRPPRGPA